MTPQIGGQTLTRVLARNDLLGRSPDEFLSLSPEAYREEYRLHPKSVAKLTEARSAHMKFVLEAEARLQTLGVTLVTAADAHFPALVEEMDPDPPGMLFMYGNLRLLESRTFCVLSSRNPRPADLDQIEQLTEEGVLEGEVLVTSHSNLAYQRSAIVPLRWGSPRILCLDCGLYEALGPDLRDEAFTAARLWRYEFDPKTDLVASPFRPHDSAIRGRHNRDRDRLVGSLSRRLDFVWISEGGNMEKLVRMALRAGRRVRVSDRIIAYREWRALGAEVIT